METSREDITEDSTHGEQEHGIEIRQDHFEHLTESLDSTEQHRASLLGFGHNRRHLFGATSDDDTHEDEDHDHEQHHQLEKAEPTIDLEAPAPAPAPPRRRSLRESLSKRLTSRATTVEEVEDLAERQQQRDQATESRTSTLLYARRSQHYWKLLVMIGLFYFIPAFEFVVWEFRLGIQLGFDSPDHECFFNFKCAHTFLGFYSFNNIVSNLFYVLVGAAFAIGVFIDQRRLGRQAHALGLDPDPSLYYAVALAIVFQGIFSAVYHVCPSPLNFQFDTTFMVVTCALFLMSQYAKRHGPLIPTAFRAYSSMMVFVVLSLFSLARWLPNYIFWTVTALVSIYLNLHVTTALYHPISDKTLAERIKEFWGRIREGKGPRQKRRFAFFSMCILINILLSIIPFSYPALEDSSSDVDTRSFPIFVLGILVISFIIYFFYYLFMKTIRTYAQPTETVPLISLVFIVLNVAFWLVGIYFFRIPTANKFLTWEESRQLNAECVLFNYFDTHDGMCLLSFFLSTPSLRPSYIFSLDFFSLLFPSFPFFFGFSLALV